MSNVIPKCLHCALMMTIQAHNAAYPEQAFVSQDMEALARAAADCVRESNLDMSGRLEMYLRFTAASSLAFCEVVIDKPQPDLNGMQPGGHA